MIKTFSNHLFESSRQDTTVLESTISVANLIKNNCKDFKWDDMPIWRQVELPTDDYYLIDPMKWHRKSVATLNLYNFIIDNEWPSNYPKREYAIIGSNNYQYLHVQREATAPIFRMIPFDGAIFGVSPRSDMFSSFKEIRKYFKVSVYKFFALLNKLYYYYSGGQLDDSTYENLKDDLNELGGWLEGTINENTIDSYFGRTKLIDYFDEILELAEASKIHGSLSNFLIKIMTPELNEFKCMNYKQLINHWEKPGDSSDKYNEVWTNQKVILVYERNCEEIKKLM